MPNLLFALQLSDLDTFSRVANTLNLSAVAREKDVSVSQISRTVSKIEASVKARLLHRGTHGLSLTAEGALLLRHAQQVLAETSELAAAFDHASGQVTGTVRVATSAAMGVFLLPSLKTLLTKHPGLVIDIQANDAIVDMARSGIDLAIRVGKHGSDNLVARPLGQFARRLFATPSYLQAHGTPKSLAELQTHRLITNTASAALNHWPLHSDPTALPPQTTVLRPTGSLRTNDSAVLVAMVLNGLGIARINATIAAPWVKSGDLVEVMAEFATDDPVPIYAVMLPERHRLPKIKACIEHWAAWFGEFSAS